MTQIPLTNTHIHTNYSFSVFTSPEEAVQQAISEDIKILGINDHYTTAGFSAFGAACHAHKLCALYSMEAVALDTACFDNGDRLNDPNNPGRCYFTAKSVTRPLTPDSSGAKKLAGMRRALTERNHDLVNRLNAHLSAEKIDVSFTMKDVEALTPAGNTTERHVIQVLAENLFSHGKEKGAEYIQTLCGEPATDIDTAAVVQDFLRKKLIKAGCPDYAPELPEAYLSREDMRELYCEMGAIPLYPVLGNPITEKEESITALIDWLFDSGIYAIEVIPNRNTPERIREIVDAALAVHIPVVTGTEHNTKTPGSLVDKFSREDPFNSAFFEGALVVRGHAAAIENGECGYVDDKGNLRFSNKKEGYEYFMERGRKAFIAETEE